MKRHGQQGNGKEYPLAKRSAFDRKGRQQGKSQQIGYAAQH